MSVNSTNKMVVFENKWLHWAISGIIAIALSVSGWFLNSCYDSMKELDKRIQALELKQVEMSGNKFTSVDWLNAKVILDADRLALDKRLTIVEENTKQVREMLMEMKQDIKDIKNSAGKSISMSDSSTTTP